MKTYNFKEGLELMQIIHRLTKLTEGTSVSFYMCPNSTCVNGSNAADKSFIWCPSYETKKANLLTVMEWAKKEITKPARAK